MPSRNRAKRTSPPADASGSGKVPVRPLGVAQPQSSPADDRFRLLAENSPDVIFHVRLKPDRRFEFINQAAQAVIGHSPSKFYAQGDLWERLVHPEDRALAAQILEGAHLNTPVPVRFVRPDGDVVWTEVHSSPLFDARGSMEGIEGVVRDVSRRRAAEENLRAQWHMYESIVQVQDQLGQGLCVLDLPEGRPVYVNAAFAKVVGYTQKELLGLPSFVSLFAPTDVPRVRDRLAGLAPEKGVRLDATAIRKDGTRAALEIHMRAIAEPARAVWVVTETSLRKRTEESRAQLAALVGSADDGIVSLTPEGTIQGWNPAAERIFGRTADEVLELQIISLVANDARDELLRGIQRALHGQSVRSEVEVQRRGGGHLPVSLTLSPIRAPDLATTGVSLMVRDEAERRGAEDALQRTLALYNATLEATGDGILVADLDGKVLSFNRRLIDLLRLPASVVAPREEQGIIAHIEGRVRDAAAWRDRTRAAMEDPSAEVADTLELTDGAIIDRAIRPQRVGDQVVGRVWTFRDVTAAHRAEHAIRLASELAFDISEADDVGAAYRIVLKRFSEQTGWSLGQVWLPTPQGRLECADPWFSTGPQLEPFHAHSRTLSILPGQSFAGPVWKNREPRWIADIAADKGFLRADVAKRVGIRSGVAIPVTLQDEAIGVLEFFSTEKRPLDPNMLSLMASVATQLGVLLDKKRSEEALRAKSDELAKLNAELEQFVYFASHDLREPLHVVLGYLQRLERRYKAGAEPEFDQMWDFAVKGAVHMQELIKDLLAYARLGKAALKIAPTDTGVLLESVIANLKWDLDESHATITRGTLPTIEIDGKLLGQVFQNLLSNAIKFRRAKTRIQVSAKKEGDEWHFVVKDNGIGIRKEDADRIFVIFQRLHTQEEYPGTGIGLSMCKRIVDIHGGRIWIESEVGKGSAFHFRLPAKQAAGGAA